MDVSRWKLDVERWMVAVLLAVVGRCWPLLAVVGRSDVRPFRRWTFGGWTSDVGCLTLHVGLRDIGRWDVGTLDVEGWAGRDVGNWKLDVGRWTLDVGRWTCGRADVGHVTLDTLEALDDVGRRWTTLDDVGTLDRTDVQTLDIGR